MTKQEIVVREIAARLLILENDIDDLAVKVRLLFQDVLDSIEEDSVE